MCKTESEHTTEKSERERELASPPLLPQTRATEKSERERERERENFCVGGKFLRESEKKKKKKRKGRECTQITSSTHRARDKTDTHTRTK
jgi:hypothetical protein